MTKRLALTRESVAALTTDDLGHIGGGSGLACSGVNCAVDLLTDRFECFDLTHNC